jgi:hypothetical protein
VETGLPVLSTAAPSRTGGTPVLRISVKGNGDVASSLLGPAAGGDLRDRIHRRYRGAFTVQLFHEPCGRSDLLLDQLVAAGPPAGWDCPGPDAGGPSFIEPLHSRFWAEPADVVVLPLQPDIDHQPWEHRASGRRFFPDPGRGGPWDRGFADWLTARCRPVEPFTAGQCKESLRRVIRAVKERIGAHVLVYTGSSIEPGEDPSRYHGRPEPRGLRVQRFNLAVFELSAEEGIAVIDVDRVLGELGAQWHVLPGGRYSDRALAALQEEVVRVLEDIGFFERRPLLPQLGRLEG